MKKPLRSLPAGKRRELDSAVAILRESFADTVSTRKADRLKHGRILKIILFGSYARGDWVHDPVGRYFSDFDLLVVVDHEDLTDLEFWETANERLLNELSSGQLRTPVTFIVHSLDDVNGKLELGRYLRAAYVKARYSRHYKINDEELSYLTERIALLRRIVIDTCEARLANLRARATTT